eukprot:2352732-Pleurochrysis_carterae.AAC.2
METRGLMCAERSYELCKRAISVGARKDEESRRGGGEKAPSQRAESVRSQCARRDGCRVLLSPAAPRVSGAWLCRASRRRELPPTAAATISSPSSSASGPQRLRAHGRWKPRFNRDAALDACILLSPRGHLDYGILAVNTKVQFCAGENPANVTGNREGKRHRLPARQRQKQGGKERSSGVVQQEA